MKKLGIPTTLGELRMLLEVYPDETLLQFRNQPVQELIEVDGDICFQETNRWDNIRIANIEKGIIGNGFAMAICTIAEARSILIARKDMLSEPLLPMVPDLPFDRESLSLELTIPKENVKTIMLRAAESFEELATAFQGFEVNDHKKHKGHERPYKFHR